MVSLGRSHRSGRWQATTTCPSTWIIALCTLVVSAVTLLFIVEPLELASSASLRNLLDPEKLAAQLPSFTIGRRPKTQEQQEEDGAGQISHANQTLAEFLSIYPETDLIWLTLADIFYSETCTPHLQRFVEDLQPYSALPIGEDERMDIAVTRRKHRLVTLCLDPGCMDACKRRGWTCYGEYESTRPDIILPATWPKLKGLIDILETGRDAVFVDSDVFFRSDPFDRLAPLGTHDLQIQDETVEGTVNTGFFHIVSTPETIAHWRGVLAMDMKEVSRDQRNTNILLGTTELRTKENTTGPGPDFVNEFTSKNGIDVKVIPPETVYAFHVGLSYPAVQWTDAVAWHGTCLESREYKYLLPREHGYWQDLDGYYSEPPKMLVLPVLTGTQEQVLRQFNQFAYLAMATNRSMVPPATVNIVLEDGRTVNRGLFSVFPMHEIAMDRALPVLESQYIEHAVPYHSSNSTTLVALTASNPVRTRAYPDVQTLSKRLLQKDFKHKLVITLTEWEAETLGMGGAKLQDKYEIKETCYHLEELPGCDRVCRKKTN